MTAAVRAEVEPEDYESVDVQRSLRGQGERCALLLDPLPLDKK